MRIAIVNDVVMATEALRRVLTSVPGYRVAWVAADGAEAVEKCRRDTPDLILMDLIMPVMDGVEATRRIMAQTPCGILVVTDVDMPRMDGIELLKLIRKDSRLQSLPVMIVSYKDRQEDRGRGLEAGADYYLTKASFHDETLLQVVTDLIGGSEA